MIIDCNTYLGTWPYWQIDASNAEKLAKNLEKNGIDKALVSSLKSVFFDSEEGDKELIEACDRFPDKLYGLATLTPWSSKDGVGHQGLASGQFKGIRIYPAYHYFSLSNSGKILETAESTRATVVVPYRLIMNWELPTLAFPEVMNLVRTYPKVPFVVSCINYEAYSLLSYADIPENLHIETSALQHESGIDQFAGLLGADKLLLGTAAPVQYPQPGVQKVVNSRLNAEQKEMIMHANASRLFRV